VTPKRRAAQFRANAANCERRAKDTHHPKIAGEFRFLAQRWRQLAAQVEAFQRIRWFSSESEFVMQHELLQTHRGTGALRR
jgi:hypothetical protein